MNERVLEKARSKVKKNNEVKFRFVCIGTVAFTSKVNVTMFIMMKTVVIIWRGRNAGIANVETYRDRQGQTGTDKDRPGQTWTDKDKQGHTGTDRDRQGQARTGKDRQGQAGTERGCPSLSLFFPVCPCLVPDCPCLSLLVPAMSLVLTGIIGK